MLAASQHHLICCEFLAVKTEESGLAQCRERIVFMGSEVFTTFQSPGGQSPL